MLKGSIIPILKTRDCVPGHVNLNLALLKEINPDREISHLFWNPNKEEIDDQILHKFVVSDHDFKGNIKGNSKTSNISVDKEGPKSTTTTSINSRLYIGSIGCASNGEILKENGITHILTVGKDLNVECYHSQKASANIPGNNNLNRKTSDSKEDEDQTVESMGNIFYPRGEEQEGINQVNDKKCTSQPMEDTTISTPSLPNKEYVYCNIEIEDNESANIAQYFPITFNFIEEALSSDPSHRVLVHCFMGKSRSSTILCAYLMRKYQLRFVPALDILRKARRQIQPNPNFCLQLKKYEKELRQAFSFQVQEIDSCCEKLK